MKIKQKINDGRISRVIIMLNKNTLGVKKVRGQSEATCKQAGATKSFDIS